MDQKIIAALLLPSAYPEPTEQVTVLQTHVSCLFITDTHVYKVKKNVNFGFLDFSTLEQRHYFCREEVRLNTRLCPDMYLGVVAIGQSAAGIAIDGAGTIIEYAVKMRRLPADRMLNRLLDINQVTEADIQAIARTIAVFHRSAITSEEISRHGSPKAIRENWRENFRQLPPIITAAFPATELQQLHDWGETFINDQMPLLNKRVTEGFIRDCDGDIHSENICLAEQIRIFDCIEFNPRFRYSDTAADLAFLLMDLDYHQRPDLATVAVAAYTAITGDGESVHLLPFYKVYRALIRGKVEALRSQDQHCSEQERPLATNKATAYLRLARGLSVRSKLPTTLIMMCGLMGCGKSTLARELAFELGLQLVSSDVMRKELAGISPQTPVRENFAAGLYSRQQTAQTYEAMAQRVRMALPASASIIVDASFGNPADRAMFIQLAAELHCPHVLLYLWGPDRLHIDRLKARAQNSTDPSDGRVALYAQQQRQFSAPDIDSRTVRLDASLPLDRLVQQVYQVIIG